MITNAFKDYCRLLLLNSYSSKAVYGYAHKSVQGNDRYICPSYFHAQVLPYEFTDYLYGSANNAGFSVGSGSTAPTGDDYQLESTITTISQAKLTTMATYQKDGNPVIVWQIPVTNTGSESIIVREIGMKQILPSIQTIGSTPNTNFVFLLDRTVLQNPITIAPGETKNILYTFEAMPLS